MLLCGPLKCILINLYEDMYPLMALKVARKDGKLYTMFVFIIIE